MHGLKDMPISFPGLFGDWLFTPTAVAFRLFGRNVYWYGIFIALGVIVALFFCARQAKRFGISEDTVYDLILYEIPIGIIGARIYYVIFYLSLYRRADGSLDFRRMLAVSDGGLAIYGTVIFCFLFAVLYCRKKKLNLFAVTDLLVMGLQIGQAFGRWGNFMNREAFGAETTLPWRMRVYITATETAEVHPTFFYESVWSLVGFVILYFVITKRRRFVGENTCIYFLWYGLGRAWIEGLRTDSLYLFDWQLFGNPIRVSQALSVMMVAASTCLLLYGLKLHPQKREEESSDGNTH